MGQRKSPGLVKRNGLWHIDKRIGGRRICQSTGTDKLGEAEQYLARLIETTRQAQIYGVRPSRTFEEAAAKYVLEHQHKRSIMDDVGRLQNLMPWIGHVPIERLHRGVLEPWIEFRRMQGRAAATINQGLKIVSRITNLAASEWIDEHGLSWLHSAPKFRLLPNTARRKPYPLSWDEQEKLFKVLPDHLASMALFAVNTGCRDGEICHLRWDWEVKVPSMQTSVFIVPEEFVKNGDERLVVLNKVAESIVESQRGKHKDYVFSYRDHPIRKMLNTGWINARNAVGLPMVRVHDLKHTFGRRLRAAGVSFEDRQDLLGHRSGRMTTHYSAAELANLIEAANAVCSRRDKVPELVVLRRLSIV